MLCSLPATSALRLNTDAIAAEQGAKACYSRIAMSRIDAIVEDLKILPPERLEEAAAYIHQLRQASQAQRLEALRATAGSLTTAEADDWAKAIDECERADESGW